jgi:hypothetical protein
MLGRSSARVATAIALAAAVAVAAGCGGERLDSNKIEDQIQSDLDKNLPKVLAQGALGEKLQRKLGVSPNEKVASVDCPSDVEIEPKATFTCTVTFANGRQATEEFKIRDKDANVEQISFKPVPR